jgi:pimeloyl-ACP methyl ester carboxylesterase
MPSISVQGVRLDYVWYGPSPNEAPTIVFLHEGLGCVEMWRDFPEQVVEKTGFGGLIYSRAGYGKSDPISLPRPVTFMHHEALEVLPAIIDSFEISEPILFGHSDGGSIALIYAGSEPVKPIKALVLEAPHVFVETLSIASIEKARNEFEKGSLKSGLQRYHGNNLECAFRGWNDVWLNPEFRSWNIESFLPNISSPVLLIQGENDQYGTRRQLESISASCRGPVQTELLADCGHSLHRDQPQLVVEIVSSFLTR